MYPRKFIFICRNKNFPTVLTGTTSTTLAACTFSVSKMSSGKEFFTTLQVEGEWKMIMLEFLIQKLFVINKAFLKFSDVCTIRLDFDTFQIVSGTYTSQTSTGKGILCNLTSRGCMKNNFTLFFSGHLRNMSRFLYGIKY